MVIIEGRIHGKQRPRYFNGRAITPKNTVNYENWIRINYREQDGRYIEGPIEARIFVYHKVPKSYSKKRIEAIREGLEYPTKKPDLDNIVKVILDSLNGIAYKDDSQVVKLIVLKKWTEGIERIEFGLESFKG